MRLLSHFSQVVGAMVLGTGCMHHGSASETKIFGGQPALAQPFLVGIVQPVNATQAVLCGGTLVTKHIVVTAAHCTSSLQPGTPLLLGSAVIQPLLDPTSATHLQNTATVQKVVVYPSYQAESGPSPPRYDLAIVVLNDYDAKAFSNPVSPLALNRDASEPEAAGSGTLYGWGRTETQPYSQILRTVTVPIVAQSDCQKAYGGSATIDATVICDGDLTSGKIDSCQGDSGGPLVVAGTAGLTLAGVVSWSKGCAVPGAPGVNTRVSTFLPWIDALISANETPISAQ